MTNNQKQIMQRGCPPVESQEKSHPPDHLVGNCPRCGNPIYGDRWLRTYDGTVNYYYQGKTCPPRVLRTCDCFTTPDRFNAENK